MKKQIRGAEDIEAWIRSTKKTRCGVCLHPQAAEWIGKVVVTSRKMRSRFPMNAVQEYLAEVFKLDAHRQTIYNHITACMPKAKRGKAK